MTVENLLQQLVTELDDENTVAIGLTGSHARGDATRYSDLDIWHYVETIDDEPYTAYTLRQYDEYLVSFSRGTLAAQRDKMNSASGALSAVPGLRQMRVLLDKTGELTTLVDAARRFDWQVYEADAIQYASHELLGNAEEAHKVMNGLARSEDYLQVYGVLGLTLGMTHTVALFKGVLADSENVYFRQVEQATGLDSEWTRQHRIALGLVMASPHMRALAALRLYRETATLLKDVILPEHQAVISSTLKRLSRFVDSSSAQMG